MNKALMPGSFDPVTSGHLDMIKRAASVCDVLDIGVFRNYSKNSMFTVEQRIEMLKACTKDIGNVNVISFDGLLVDFVMKGGYDAVFRGLRNADDFNYELQLSQLYDHFYKGSVQTVYLMTAPEYSYISSSIVRENFMLGADIEGWVPGEVLELMKYFRLSDGPTAVLTKEQIVTSKSQNSKTGKDNKESGKKFPLKFKIFRG